MNALVLAFTLLAAVSALPAVARPLPSAEQINAQVLAAMAATESRGLAIAVIDGGQVQSVRSFGQRNAAGQPLEANTIMYGASLTKAAFAHLVMQLVDEGKLDLDRPIGEYLDRPLPEYANEDKYAPWADLAGDARWRQLTARILLTHSAGFSNFSFLQNFRSC